VLYGKLAPVLPPLLVNLTVSTIFVFFHAEQYSFIELIDVLVISLILGYFRHRYDSLTIPIIFHISANSLYTALVLMT